MSWWRVFRIVWGNVRRNRRAFVLSSIGLIVGVATLTFFVHLGMGVQDGVLNKIYPVNQIEIEPKTVGLLGTRQQVVDAERLSDSLVDDFRALPDVVSVYPKLRSKLQARLWGGKSLFGYSARAEAFFDGLDPQLLADELKALERVEDKRARVAGEVRERCLRDDECALGQECRADGRCGDIEYWTRFADHGIVVPCEAKTGDDGCPPGDACVAGLCQPPCGEGGACDEGQACVAAVGCADASCGTTCAARCEVDGDCPMTHGCAEGPAGIKVCRRHACELPRAESQFSERPGDMQGRLVSRCANGVSPESEACEPLPCPSNSYCAATSVQTSSGFCEAPIPVILSPVLVELFNSSAASSLGMQKIDGVDALLGFGFRFHLGDSYFTADLPRHKQAVKQAQIVGFSQKALEFGVTMPTAYVRAINARYKGRAAAERFDTFILETRGNEDVSGLISTVDRWGFSLSRKSKDAQKAGDLLLILTIVFSFISVVIMVVAAVNIMHTFLTLITERRYEIGIMRAIGARRRDVRVIILCEAGLLGLFGGILGNLLSWGFSRGVNLAAAEYLQGIPFRPDEFFAYDWRVVLGGIVFAWVFCLIGALFPANRAAKLDPAVVLTN